MTRMAAVIALIGVLVPAAGCSRPSDQFVQNRIALYAATASPGHKTVEEKATRTHWDRPGDSGPIFPSWQARSGPLAGDVPDPDAKAEVTDKKYVIWPLRRGPAYPGRFWPSVGRDLKELPATFWDDTKATFNYPVSVALLAATAATGAALSGDANDAVEDHFTEHGSQLNTFWDSVGDAGGSPLTHFIVAGAMYGASLANNDVKNYEKSKTLINALAVTGAITLATKVTFNTESPNGDDYGWLSGHSSSSFCFATVMCDQYGPWVGVPLYAFATFVAYERIDARNHDFNDVVSGSLLGIAVGYAVSRNHQFQVLGMDVIPYGDPRGGTGLALYKRW